VTPVVPVLAGPTASGKSALALELGEAFGLEVVSADAMMVYRGMDIGTAKPPLEERGRVPHHLVDIVAPDESFSVAAFVVRAEAAIADVLGRGRLPLVVGGTGFYIRALSEGLPTLPPADPEVQKALWARLEREGLDTLIGALESRSPADAARAQRNPRRVVRALEVLERTGRPPASFPRTAPRFLFDKRVLTPSAEVLAGRIEARTRGMFRAGLVEEVRSLLARYPASTTAMQAIGYKEVRDHLQGRLSLGEAEREVTQATLRYAKRQRTWFRGEPGARTLCGDPSDELGALRAWLEALLARM